MFTTLVSLAADAAEPVVACLRTHTVVAVHPHDPQHFTQGLVIAGEHLFESTGLYGQSAIFIKELRSGRVLSARRLPSTVFGEGLALLDDRLVQITWLEQLAFVHDLDLTHTARQAFSGEGWGLTSLRTAAGPRLVASDGSQFLRLLSPDTLVESGRLAVADEKGPVTQLNELETVNGEILANVWHSPRVAVIDPLNGRVRGWFDFSDLVARVGTPPGWDRSENVLNGLAYDPASGNLFVTGKRWPSLFELRLGACEAARKSNSN